MWPICAPWPDRHVFCGALTGPDLAAAYAGCRYFVFLPYAEEFGLAALDAWPQANQSSPPAKVD